MLSRLKLVVFDYPKFLVQDEVPKRILGDFIQAKQINYDRSDDNYISIGNLDMVSTHVLIYDMKNIFKPKIVLAIRNVYEDRVRKHNLRLPSDDYIPHLAADDLKKFNNFKKDKTWLADCGAFFIDTDFSYNKTKFPIADIGLMMMVNHLFKRGFHHLVGATNMTFKSSRWVEPIGRFEDGITFQHPYIRHPHQLILLNEFKLDWLRSCYDKYFHLWQSRMEFAPPAAVTGENLISDDDLYKFVLDQAQLRRSG